MLVNTVSTTYLMTDAHGYKSFDYLSNLVSLAGYGDLTRSLEPSELIARYCSIGTSLITLPMASHSYVIAQTKKGAFGPKFEKHVESCTVLVMFFSVTELWMATDLMILQLIFRPFGV